MVEEGARRGAKRRCARSKYTSAASMPSAIHYVGYVEDDETPEMIMAKFMELERIKAAAGQAKAAQPLPAIEPPARGTDVGGEAALLPALPGLDELQETQDTRPQQRLQESDQATQELAGAVAGDRPEEVGGLTDEQLLEVFKQTSMFNVRTALQDNEMLLGIDDILDATNERYADEEAVSDDEDISRAFWSDEDDVLLSDLDDDPGETRRHRRRGGSGRASRQGSGVVRAPQRGAACMRARHNVITAFNPTTQALVRRRVRVGTEREELYHLRVPPAPIPVAWGRTVRPYVPLDQRLEQPMAVPVPPALLKAMEEGGGAMDIATMEQCVYREVHSVAETDWGSLAAGCGHQAVLINPGWACEGRGDLAMQRLAKLPMRRLVPKGFVFIFVEKQHVQALCRQMRAWGYCYIENLTWVYLCPNNNILELPSRYVNSSHLTLYMFRREGEGKGIELRHQRNPDVTFDCLARTAGAVKAVPQEIFVAIETLLPTGKGQFLELWAPHGMRRPGWQHVVEMGSRDG